MRSINSLCSLGRPETFYFARCFPFCRVTDVSVPSLCRERTRRDPSRMRDLVLHLRILLGYFRRTASERVSIASDLLSDPVKRALLSVKESHKSETERQKQTPCAVNQAFCHLAQGARLPSTFVTPRILVFVTRVSWRLVRTSEIC